MFQAMKGKLLSHQSRQFFGNAIHLLGYSAKKKKMIDKGIVVLQG